MAGLIGTVIDPSQVRDIAPEVLDPDTGRMRVLPAAYWATTTRHERALFGHRHGLYGFPTVELVDYLREVIGDRSAIEIGAGHGVLADALGIPGTDNRQQEMPEYRAVYKRNKLPTTVYGPNIVHLDAAAAIERYRPQVVIGCWVTHRYDPARHEAGGNEIGIDERAFIDSCELYVVVGNQLTHQHKAIWDLPHSIAYPPFVYSRAVNGSPDFVAAWSRLVIPGGRR